MQDDVGTELGAHVWINGVTPTLTTSCATSAIWCHFPAKPIDANPLENPAR